MTNEQDLPTWLREQCGHDSRSEPECGYCEAADKIERLELREAKARAILEPMAECDPQIREWLKCQS